MELEHSFTVAAPPEQAWRVLLDLERIVPCMPGASLTSYQGDEFAGNVRVKLGPVLMTFAGSGRFTERNETARRMVVEASGKEKRGGGTARATIQAVLREQDGATAVDVYTDLMVTGRAAQFGRGMIADVSTRLLTQFTDCLAEKLAGAPAAPQAPAGDTGAGQPTPATAAPEQVAAREPAATAAPAEGAAGEPAATATAREQEPPPGEGGQPVAQPARPASTEPIDLLGVTGARAAIRRAAPYVLVFAAGVLVGSGITVLLMR